MYKNESACFCDRHGRMELGDYGSGFNRRGRDVPGYDLEPPIDTAVSEKRIGLKIKMAPIEPDVPQITPRTIEQDESRKGVAFFGHVGLIESTLWDTSDIFSYPMPIGSHCVVLLGHCHIDGEWHSLPRTFSYPKAVETSDQFDAKINNVENGVAHVSLYDSNGKESFVEIPEEEIKDNKITCRKGISFKFSTKQRGEWEAVEMKPMPAPKMPAKEFGELVEYYREKYEGV